ncbi:MAG TPA: hypothetical protein VFX86_01495 [Candidatus Saccharimonadales bacterium]|nr:hypothetical protein [Candidatus Saccharimonadales bacterium]
MIDERFVILAVIVNFAGSLNYLVNTLKGDTKPNRVTWFLWALFPMIAFSAMLDKDVGTTPLVLTFMSGFMPLMIFSGSFINRNAFWKITRFDWTCGILSFAGLILWFITREGNIAIALSILADALALLPTLVKSYKFPKTESWAAFGGAAAAAFITMLTIKVWTFAAVAFPLYIFIVCVILSVLIKFKIGPKLTPSIKGIPND